MKDLSKPWPPPVGTVLRLTMNAAALSDYGLPGDCAGQECRVIDKNDRLGGWPRGWAQPFELEARIAYLRSGMIFFVRREHTNY